MDTATEVHPCGRCGETFPTDAEVFSHPCPLSVRSRFVQVPNGLGGTTTVKRDDPRAPQGPRPATQPMINFLRSLVERKGVEVQEGYVDWVIAQGFDRVSKGIDTLKALPDKAPSQAPSQPDVPEGHYAVPTQEGHLAFYRVDRPTEGRWSGYTFVKLQVSDDYQRLSQQASKAILATIAEDVQGAMLTYGREIGRCGHCNRTLTNEVSRAAGIGPVCREGMGW